MIEKESSREIRRRIRCLLMERWNPIGVSDTPAAADEYDSYIGDVYELIKQDASSSEISAYLCKIEVDQMGMLDANGSPLLPTDVRSRAASSLKDLARLF